MDGSSEPPSDVQAVGSESEPRGREGDGGRGDSPPPLAESEFRPARSAAGSLPGCGCVGVPEDITLTVTPTTGGQFDLTIDRAETIENLKKIISKRLKVAKERICLLHRERQLRDGTLEENHLQDGSRLTLLPSVETGLLAQRPEQSVMQALESLNDSQVNDFLSGKAPLNLTMRLGDHMMLIQLQLSTVTPATPTTGGSPTSGATSSGSSPGGGSNTSSPTGASSSTVQSRRPTVLAARTSSSASGSSGSGKQQNGAFVTSSLISSLASALAASTALSTATKTTSSSPGPSSPCSTSTSTFSASQSPGQTRAQSPQGRSASPSRNTGTTSTTSTTSPSSSSSPRQSYLLHHHHHHRTHHFHRSHHYHQHHHHHHHHHSRKVPAALDHPLEAPTSLGTCPDPLALGDAPSSPAEKKFCDAHHHPQVVSSGSEAGRSYADLGAQGSATSTSVTETGKTASSSSSATAATLDTRALAEASRNLTQKLKQLSSEENARRRQGAIIESMHHHGKGVYSGTFSGTLNPALQDRYGRPKRDISTIIHILNDLLCATPVATTGHYRGHHHRHTGSRQQWSSTSSSGVTAATGNGATSPGTHDSTNPGYSSEELSKENEATKGKMRRLRLVMEQRRAKRKARRQARAAPYTTQWAAVTPDPDPNHDPNTTSTSTGGGGAAGPNAAEPQNEPELQPCSPEPVVA
ncbi:midnolin [Orussus abietinus]|uniref:midnolin n=1 Tax=Orussus abietinus TaxID=222816 RepID=UPI0006264186|nr:midnolin [Orussus abietinus]